MAGIEKKLAVFSNTVLTDANEKKERLQKEIDREREQAIHEHELEYLQDAYEDIQKAVSRCSKECNEEALKLELELKKDAIHKREAIISEVFCEVEKKLSAFIASEEYPAWLADAVERAERELSEGRKKIEVLERDLPLLAGREEEIVAASENLIGGARVYNLDRNTFSDYSIAAILEEEHEKFLKTSGLSIRA